VERAIILAAGRGERLVNGFPYPKPLKPVLGVPLIERVLGSLRDSGVDEVAIVVGYLGDVLRKAVSKMNVGIDVRFIENDEWHKPNGTSLLKAASFVTGPTFLLMSDHLWSLDLIEHVRRFPLAADESLLGIDFKIAECFDIDDATKVAVDGDRIVRISKTLPQYDALDTGVFRITPALIDALRAADGPDGCSLSQGVAALAQNGRMRVVDVQDATWVDVDTPEAHAQAEMLLRRHGNALRSGTRGRVVDRAVAAFADAE